MCGVRGNDMTSVKILRVTESKGKLIKGGYNICITGDLTILLDVSDITPIDISVALGGTSTSLDDPITKRGLLPLTLSDGSIYYQTCFFCANMVETIISPAAILALSDVFYYWNQEGCKDPTAPGRIRFTSKDGILSMFFNLEYRKGLYYCSSDIITVDQDTPVWVNCHCTTTPTLTGINHTPSKFVPTSRAHQVESEVWLARLGSPGESQLYLLPGHVIGMPPVFEHHPFRLINFKEQAYIQIKLHSASRNGFPCAVQNSLWTLHLCRLRPATINAPTSTLIKLSLRTTDTPLIWSSSIALHAESGPS